MNMRNSLNDHIHTKCAINLACIYQFYEKKDEEEVWGSSLLPLSCQCKYDCQCSFSFTLFPIEIYNATEKMVCTCSSQNSKVMQFFYTFTTVNLRSPLSLDMVPRHWVIGARHSDPWRWDYHAVLEHQALITQ